MQLWTGPGPDEVKRRVLNVQDAAAEIMRRIRSDMPWDVWYTDSHMVQWTVVQAGSKDHHEAANAYRRYLGRYTEDVTRADLEDDIRAMFHSSPVMGMRIDG